MFFENTFSINLSSFRRFESISLSLFFCEIARVSLMRFDINDLIWSLAKASVLKS